MALLVLCLRPESLLDPNDSFASFSGRLTISPVVERLVFAKASAAFRLVRSWAAGMYPGQHAVCS